jgi:hypothetical protein
MPIDDPIHATASLIASDESAAILANHLEF